MNRLFILLCVFPINAFAEVYDKAASIPSLWLTGIILTIIIFTLSWLQTWTAIFSVFVISLYFYINYVTITDPHIGRALFSEKGYSYILAEFVPIVFMVFGLFFGLYLNRKRNAKNT